jgi:tRNA U34 5-methylaminomethyl-2-thiouridine-forming methyltransferase MnmC
MEKNNMTQRQIITTEDGSSSLKLNHFEEQFHSIHGAMSESLHIYIHAGFKLLLQHRISIFEMGFGTGLNALLTLAHSTNKQVHYHTIEAFPLHQNEYLALNYVDLVYAQGQKSFSKEELYHFFVAMHQSESGVTLQMTPYFSFTKEIIRLEEKTFENQSFDLVYFDAFSPETQPELWDDSVFEKLYAAMQQESILITYCAKGTVKRSLKKAGFRVESLPGPTGKREITKAIK